MGCFISREDNEYKANLKTAKVLSRAEPEDRKARQEKEEKDLAWAKEQSLKDMEKVRLKKLKEIEKQEDEQLQKTHNGQRIHSYVNPPPASISNRGKSVIEGGESVNPQALCCQVCHEPFDVDEIAKKGKYHKHCYKHRSKCYVCEGKFPLNEKGERRCNWHPFWKKKYCPVHDKDGTPKCCSCERLEPKETNYVTFEDGRKQCLECMESSVMDSGDSQYLQSDMFVFFDGLFLKVEKTFPILLVKKQALHRAAKNEKGDTRGLCLSKEQNVRSIIKGPRLGPDKQLTEMVTKKQRVRGCDVTGILIIYGLPRLLYGYILAHEMMHAWLRLNGYRDLKEELEEGLCQMLALRWLESLTYAFPDTAAASASSSTTPAASTLKKGDPWSDFEKKLIKFCIYQIKEDDSLVYGKGFQQINNMMLQNKNYTIKKTVQEIVRASKAKARPDANQPYI